MTKNYFAVERDGKCIDKMLITKEDGSVAFEDVMDMSYNEISNYEDIDAFVTCVMGATNEYFEDNDKETIVTLVDEDDVFIWSILIGPGEVEDELKFNTIDWRKDYTRFRYEK